ncbi:MAG: hypothetical protein WCC08_16195, partial [Terrimicrobiaceae bacterium]
ACTCPASSPDRFRDEAAEIAAVVFAIRMMLCLTLPCLCETIGNGAGRGTPGTRPGDECAPNVRR